MSAPEVAIVGIGIHPFGRHDGVSGRAMGVHAVREALGDAGVGWSDVDFAFGGSKDGGNADTMVADPDRLRIGQPVRLVIVPFGDQVTYAFAPQDDALETSRA